MAKDMTLREVVEELRVSPATVYRWLTTGKLKGYRLGGTKAGWRIPVSEVEKLKDGASDG